jgi:hypothetical protein
MAMAQVTLSHQAPASLVFAFRGLALPAPRAPGGGDGARQRQYS